MYPSAHAAVQLAVVNPIVLPKRPALHGPLHVALGRAVDAPYWPNGHGEHTPAPDNE